MKLKIVLVAAALMIGAAAQSAGATTLIGQAAAGKAATEQVAPKSALVEPAGVQTVHYRHGGIRFRIWLGGVPLFYNYQRHHYYPRYFHSSRKYYKNYHYRKMHHKPYLYYYNGSNRSRY